MCRVDVKFSFSLKVCSNNISLNHTLLMHIKQVHNSLLHMFYKYMQYGAEAFVMYSASLAGQTFARKMGRSGDISIPVFVPVEHTECNVCYIITHKFVHYDVP